MAETKHETRQRPARGNQELEMNSEITARRSVVTIVVVAVVLAVAAALLTAHGWGLTLQQFIDTLHQLPRPVQTLLGGSHLAHLLHAGR